MYKENISFIQQYLKRENIDAYILFLSDDHGSEYVLDAYKGVSFMCGFTGSNATLLISQEEAYLWTDGRYFLQAELQLKESNTKLMKMGQDISYFEFISKNINSLVFDFKLANVSIINSLLECNKNLKLIDNSNILNDVWKNRPKIKNKKIFLLEEKAYRFNAYDKCVNTIKSLKYKGNCSVIISALDDIAFLLNARGKDIPCNPVFMAFMMLSKNNNRYEFSLYINKNKLNKEVKEYLKHHSINIKSYEQIYEDVKDCKNMIFYDENKTNYKLYSLMQNKQATILYPTLSKAIKTNVDIKESKKAHIKDGVAMCKFLYYLHKNVNTNKLSELSISKHLEKLRRQQGAIEPSFNTIAGYKEHGAIIHYSANKNSNKTIENDGFLLVDSGGQYLYGTTDITRTIAFNNITSTMKRHFTLALKSHIDLAMAIFNKTTTDAQLDLIARKPLWDNNLDYNHGTGHGIGHFLNVHEGPQSIRHNKVNPTIMKKGMITSNEPGLYFENQYGIRHENELLCVNKPNNMLGFEVITYVPFDIKAIEPSLLNQDEIDWINNYHKLVYKKINKYLNEKEKNYLKEITKEITYASN